MKNSRFAALFSAFLAISLVACGQAPADENGPATDSLAAASQPVASAPIAPVQASSPLAAAQLRNIELEARVAKLEALLQAFSVDEAGNVTFTGNLQVNGAVGVNTAPVLGTGISVIAPTVGVKAVSSTGFMARGGNVGVDAEGAANGILAISPSIAVASSGSDYSFYGFHGEIRNDAAKTIRKDAQE